jgi:hypothetical protein
MHEYFVWCQWDGVALRERRVCVGLDLADAKLSTQHSFRGSAALATWFRAP